MMGTGNYTDQSHRTFAHFTGKLVRCLVHDAPSHSGVGASGKPGAVQHAFKRLVGVIVRICQQFLYSRFSNKYGI